MEKVIIAKATLNDWDCYVFRPMRYITHFFQRTAHLDGIGYHAVLRASTLPLRDSVPQELEQIFGAGSLSWTYRLPKNYRIGGSSRAQEKVVPKKVAPNNLRAEAGGKSPKSKIVSVATPGSVPSFSDQWRQAIHRTEEKLRQHRYSWQTVKGYVGHLRIFARAHVHLSPDSITLETIRQYIINRVKQGSYSESTQQQLLNALKFWLEKIEGKDQLVIDLRPRKTGKRLPIVLSRDEITRLFAATTNQKHRCVLKVLYSGGLTLSEVCQLRIVDLHRDRLQIYVHGGSGKQERFTTLSKNFLSEVDDYLRAYQPDYWLFEGRAGGQYATRSIQAIMKQAVHRSQINPKATVHTLRHSYAVHLLEQGTSLRHLQELLGHKSSRSTEVYTRVLSPRHLRITSPLDKLE